MILFFFAGGNINSSIHNTSLTPIMDDTPTL